MTCLEIHFFSLMEFGKNFGLKINLISKNFSGPIWVTRTRAESKRILLGDQKTKTNVNISNRTQPKINTPGLAERMKKIKIK